MTLPANIRVNVGAPFPSRVQGAAFIAVAKASGIWTITPNYALLNSVPLTVTQEFVVYDPITKLHTLQNVSTMVAAGLNIYRIVTIAGDVTATITDVVIIMNKTSGQATNINLPNSAARNGAPLTVKDLKGDANTNNITFVPSIGETIDGFSAAAAAANGVALIDINYGKKTLFPLVSGGWYT